MRATQSRSLAKAFKERCLAAGVEPEAMLYLSKIRDTELAKMEWIVRAEITRAYHDSPSYEMTEVHNDSSAA